MSIVFGIVLVNPIFLMA